MRLFIRVIYGDEVSSLVPSAPNTVDMLLFDLRNRWNYYFIKAGFSAKQNSSVPPCLFKFLPLKVGNGTGNNGATSC